jgi:hypothetical protein
MPFPFPDAPRARAAAWRRASLLLLFAVAMLGGCAQRWEKPGASEADFKIARMRCDAAGHRDLPPDLRWMQISAGYFSPGYRQCWKSRGRRQCSYSPGYYVPPRFGHVDLNVGARDRFMTTCLLDDGWRPVD